MVRIYLTLHPPLLYEADVTTEISKPLGRTAWLVLTVAAIGFLFDTYELLMTPLVLAPALSELLRVPPNHPDVQLWVGRVLWMTALCGGVFGLMGGWMIDKFGRKTVMIGSIFVYSFSPVLAGLSTDLTWLIFFRCTTFVGVCVEFVAAVTWLAELFPDKRQRELAIGWTQAFASVGGLLVTGVSAGVGYMVANKMLPTLPVGDPTNPAWRFTLMTGLLPAIPIAILLPFVPESAVWLERKKSGALRRPSFFEIFEPKLLRTTVVATILSACAYAAAFGTLQVTVTQAVPGLPDMAETRAKMEPLIKANKGLEKQFAGLDKESEEFKTKDKEFKDNLKKMGKINKEEVQPRRESVQFMQELGGLAGRILLAIALVSIASKRVLLWIFQIPGLFIIPLVWFFVFQNAPHLFSYGVFLAGLCIVAQFSYFGEYLPKVFPVHLRGTGSAFATNVGGRMIGTSAAFLTTNLIAPMLTIGSNNFEKVAYAAGITGVLVFAIGFVTSFFLLEPKAEGSPE
ncbi:MAG: MFS transporter [Planctomycetota bacterium]|nr:MAG: MFS transporter [Planctomycetota bacterium]